MNNIYSVTDSTETITLHVVCDNGNKLVYGAATEPRITEVIDGKCFTTTEEAAEELANEMRAAGVREARALGFAVVFWG